MKRNLFILLFLFSLAAIAQVNRKSPPTPLSESTINFGEVENFTLSNGLKVIVVENHKLPVVRVDLYLDVTAIKEGSKAGYTSIFGDMLRAGTIDHTKEELDERIDFLGSDFYAGSTYMGISSLKKQLIPTMKIMKELLFNSTFNNQTELDKLKKQLRTSLEANDKNPDVISGRVKNVLLYGKEDAWGEYATEQTIDNIQLSDFRNHYNIYFKPNIAYLTIVGDITVPEARAIAEECFGSWEPGEVNNEVPALNKNTSGMKLAFVDLPTASQSSINILGLTDLKKVDQDYFPAVLGNSILGNGASGRLFKDIREKRGWSYGVYSSLNDNYKRLGNLGIYAKVRNNVTDSAIVEIIRNIKNITAESPSKEEIDLKKAEYIGNFALGLERPETTANFMRTQMIENLSLDFYKNYLEKINNVKADEIPIALNRVIDPDNLIILIVGKGEEVLPKLEQLGYPIEYYDKYGNAVQKPGEKKVVEDLTLEEVLNKYFIAVAGSRENMEALKSIQSEAEMQLIQLPEPANVTVKFQVPNKISTTISIMGYVMKQGFDGQNGFSTTGILPQAQVEEYRSQRGYFPELNYNSDMAALEGIIPVEGKEAYKVIITSGENTKFIYFDTETGLKIREEASSKDELAVTDYSDYKNLDGYVFPTKITTTLSKQESSKVENMSQQVKNYKINPSFTDSDFQP